MEVAVVVQAGQRVGDGLDLRAPGLCGGRIQHGGEGLRHRTLHAFSRRDALGGGDLGGEYGDDGPFGVDERRRAADPHAPLVGEEHIDLERLSGEDLQQLVIGDDAVTDVRSSLPDISGVADDRRLPAQAYVAGDEAGRWVLRAHLAQRVGDPLVRGQALVVAVPQQGVLIGVYASRGLAGHARGEGAALRDAFEDAHERLDDLGVELAAAATPQFGHALGVVERLAVGAPERHGIVGVRDAHRSGDDGNTLARQPVGVAAALPAFVVMTHAADQIFREERPDDIGAENRVLAHQPPLMRVQASGLEEHAVGDADLADVVQVRSLLDVSDQVSRPAQLFTQQHHVRRHPGGVPERVVVLGVQRRAQRLQIAQVHGLNVLVEPGVVDRQRQMGAGALQEVVVRAGKGVWSDGAKGKRADELVAVGERDEDGGAQFVQAGQFETLRRVGGQAE